MNTTHLPCCEICGRFVNSENGFTQWFQYEGDEHEISVHYACLLKVSENHGKLHSGKDNA